MTPRTLFAPIVAATLLLCACGTNDPLPRAYNRPTLLTFGLYVTPDPEQNPIDPPERFTGFHSATDFEIFPGEEDKEVPVTAICDGPVTYSGFAEGYGGLIVQTCSYKDEPVSVLYGHLTVDGLPAVGTTVHRSDKLSTLAPAHSHDSDQNRKHLHLGIHHGTQPVFLGYVQTEAELSNFLDPLEVMDDLGAAKN